ncbi:hypothetical protein ACVINI_005966 [Rhizobium beringeri]
MSVWFMGRFQNFQVGATLADILTFTKAHHGDHGSDVYRG